MKDNAVTRELGKVFGLPKAEIDSLLDNRKNSETPDHIAKLIYSYGSLLYSFPSHLSIHAGGILISEESIHNYTATDLPPKNFPLTQFSMLEAEDVGLYKFDILAQRGLGKVRDAVEIIKHNTGDEIDIHAAEKFKADGLVRKNLETATLMGCFYVESPAMRMLLTKLEAKTYLDLVAASSIIRPGVASSGMMREYILRFKGRPPSYESPKAVYEILHDTFGVMVYQEDVIKVAYYFAGLTFGKADMMRRGMSGKYRARAEFQKVEKKFFDNCREKGYDDKVTKEVWRQIESFAGYAFSKGHSASYAVESYQCMYLKTYYPLEYMVAVLNNGGGFYAPEFYVHEARMCGGKKKTKKEKELFETGKKDFNLPQLHHTWLDDAWDEIEILGFSLCSPFELIASFPAGPLSKGEGEHVPEVAQLKSHLGKTVSIIGYSVTRKRTRTRRGEEMCFGTFLDKEGKWIDTTHFPDVLKKFPFMGKGCYLITGKVVEEFGFYSLDVIEMKRLDFRTRNDISEKDLSVSQHAS